MLCGYYCLLTEEKILVPPPASVYILSTLLHVYKYAEMISRNFSWKWFHKIFRDIILVWICLFKPKQEGIILKVLSGNTLHFLSSSYYNNFKYLVEKLSWHEAF